VPLSMTGFGEARRQDKNLAVGVELRTVNNRYFKFSMRSSDGYGTLEPQIEAIVRDQVKRGTVTLSLRVDQLATDDAYTLNSAVLTGYRRQLEQLQTSWGITDPVVPTSLLQLPGVVRETQAAVNRADEGWPVVQEVVREALARLNQMRDEEGRNMAIDLTANCRTISDEVDKIALRAPFTVGAYRNRLHDRVAKVLEEYGVSLNPADLIREVSIFAERSDISEEMVRLRSHLDQFHTILAAGDSVGRKLEFLIQEMFREVNTIGSKSTDVEIARHVIEMKTAIERLREMIQNVE